MIMQIERDALQAHTKSSSNSFEEGPLCPMIAYNFTCFENEEFREELEEELHDTLNDLMWWKETMTRTIAQKSAEIPNLILEYGKANGEV